MVLVLFHGCAFLQFLQCNSFTLYGNVSIDDRQKSTATTGGDKKKLKMMKKQKRGEVEQKKEKRNAYGTCE